MNVAIVGATGSCGRQVAAQMVERSLLSEDANLHLVGHAGGSRSEYGDCRRTCLTFADAAQRFTWVPMSAIQVLMCGHDGWRHGDT